VVPFSVKPYKEVGCAVCNFWQDVKYRPDVVAQMEGAAATQGPGGAVMMMGGVQGGGHAAGAPGGVPQYK